MQAARYRWKPRHEGFKNFLKENNARHMWHPMAHPADSLANPPEIIVGGDGVGSPMSTARSVDAVGGLWNVNLGYSCEPVKAGDRRPARQAALLFDLPRHLQ
jgi:adenosylmethionine-8-amino-7-oxononanoate aminotransferase